jgi:hypothetical protein
MTARASAERALALLGCLLVAAASGDDFCLPRLLFPSTLPAAEVLPLDDPNTDFVEARDPAASQRVKEPRPGGPEDFCPATSSSVPAAGCLSVASAFTHVRRAPLPELNSPLRC